MNFIDKFLVKLVLSPKKNYKNLDVDTNQLKAILVNKITIGDRTPAGIRAMRKTTSKKPTKGISIGTLLTSLFMGLFFMVSFFVGSNMLTHLSLYFSLYISILSLTLIADFTTSLIDVRDNYIILPKPINDYTMLLSRLLYIVIYIFKTAFPMTLFAMIYVGYTVGVWGLILFFILTLLATLFTIFLINATYILVLKVTSPQKFKNIIGYFQIGIAILFYAGSQILPRLIGKYQMANFNLSDSSIALFLPSYWFAGAWHYLVYFDGGVKLLLCTLFSFIIPIASIWVVVKYFGPSFNQKLAMISGTSEETTLKKNDKQDVKIVSAYLQLICKWITKKGAERMSFLHTWKITSRSRDFKMKVYPSIGYVAVLVFINFLNGNDDGEQFSIPNPDSFFYIFIIYLSNFMLLTALSVLTLSDSYKASWIYYSAPLEKPGQLLLGAVKSIIIKFALPIICIVFTVSTLFSGFSALPNIILAVCNQILISLLIAYFSLKKIPFSEPMSSHGKGGNFMRSILTLIIPLMVGGVQYLIRDYILIVFLLTALSIIASWMLADSIKNKSWDSIDIAKV